MVLDRPAFTRTRLDEERAEDKSRVFTVRLNRDELRALEDMGRLMRQEKLGTVIKILSETGRRYVLQQAPLAYFVDACFNNQRKNERTGITIPDPKFERL